MKRALLSVSDKTGLLAFARALAELSWELLSTGGTAKVLREAGLAVTDVAAYTGSPEIFDGRVKTLHPKIHGGLLYRRHDDAHARQAQEHGIAPIDLVAINLYPFEATVAKPDCSLQEAVENIDIGGPAMIRAAAKNHAAVAVLTDPADYAPVAAELRAHGTVRNETRYQLALKAFRHTARYDAAIAHYLESRTVRPPRFYFGEYELVMELAPEPGGGRAEWYRIVNCGTDAVLADAVFHGRTAPTFQDIDELNLAVGALRGGSAPTLVAICDWQVRRIALPISSLDQLCRGEQTNTENQPAAWTVGLNRTLDVSTAQILAASRIVHQVVAPSCEEAAQAILGACSGTRLVVYPPLAQTSGRPKKEYRFVEGGVLVRDYPRP